MTTVYPAPLLVGKEPNGRVTALHVTVGGHLMVFRASRKDERNLALHQAMSAVKEAKA